MLAVSVVRSPLRGCTCAAMLAASGRACARAARGRSWAPTVCCAGAPHAALAVGGASVVTLPIVCTRSHCLSSLGGAMAVTLVPPPANGVAFVRGCAAHDVVCMCRTDGCAMSRPGSCVPHVRVRAGERYGMCPMGAQRGSCEGGPLTRQPFAGVCGAQQPCCVSVHRSSCVPHLGPAPA